MTPEEKLKLNIISRPSETKATLMDSTSWGNSAEWAKITELASFFSYCAPKKGTVLAQEGSKGCYFALICKGSVVINKQSSQSTTKQIAILGRNNTFGDISFIDNLPYSASVVAGDKCELLILSKEQFEIMKSNYPAVATRLLMEISRWLCVKLRSTSGQLVDCMDAG